MAATQAATSQRASGREWRAGLHRTFEPTCPAAPDSLAALRKPAVSHGTHVPYSTTSPPCSV
eukprot:2734937-Prymnesium_polylepis.2